MKINELVEAAGKYSTKIYGFTHSAVRARYDAFVIGAEWRIKKAWRDVTEQPEDGQMLLCDTTMGYYLCGPNNTEFDKCIKDFGILRYAYVRDLIPEMEE